MKHRVKQRTAGAGLGLALALAATTLQAETWQAGLLAESGRSPLTGDREETNGLPLVNYYGERFSFVGGRIEYRLGAEGGGDLQLTGQVRSHQYYAAGKDFDDLDLDGMEDRDSAFELGLAWQRPTPMGQFSVEGLADVSGAHGGYEVTARYAYPVRAGRWLIEPALGVQWQSPALVDYYHGVRESEADALRPAYEGDRAVNTLVSLRVGYAFDAQWLALAGMEQVVLDSSIADSPIVAEEFSRKAFLGLVYTF